MGDSLYQRSFAGGELAPILHARADTQKYATGARTVKNFLVRREGGVTNRPGFRFEAIAKTADKGTRLMRFVSTVANESALIEIGNGYLRFFVDESPLRVTGVVAWSSIVDYVPGDLVVVAGVNYYCHTANTNETPPNASFWYALTGDLYEVPTPYALDELPQWNQSGNILTLTHPNHVPMELTFLAETRWVLSVVDTTFISQPPTSPSGTGGNPVPAWDATVAYEVGAIVVVTAVNYVCILGNTNQTPPNATYWNVVPASATTRAYVVTSVLADTLEESVQSDVITITDFLMPLVTAPNALAWTAPAGLSVDSYNVYEDPFGNGVFGFIGTATDVLFNDAGLTPDFTQTPPIARPLFVNTGDFPSVSAFYQQRRFMANTDNAPDAVYGSKTGFKSNFGISAPLQDDDAVTFRLAGNNHHPVRHLVPLKTGLVLLTDGGEWTATGAGGPATAITPNSLAADQETYVGCAGDVRPVTIGGNIVYVQTRGSIVREIEFAQQVQGLAGKDMTIFATHLFEGHTIVAMDFQQVPDSIIWAVRDDGVLLGLTYIPDQDVWGWHRHETQQNATPGLIEDVCVIPEAEEDGVYVVVARTIGASVVRYIERLESRVIKQGSFNSECFYVDAGLSYNGSPARTFSGLDHLEGQVVAVLADGLVVYDGDPAGANAAAFTVTAGTITLPAATAAAVDVHIGLAIRWPDLHLLPIDIQGSNVRDKSKIVHSVTLLLDRSSRSFMVGPDADHLRAYVVQAWDSPGVREFTGQAEQPIDDTWEKDGGILIRQIDPLPLTILGVLPNITTGG